MTQLWRPAPPDSIPVGSERYKSAAAAAPASRSGSPTGESDGSGVPCDSGGGEHGGERGGEAFVAAGSLRDRSVGTVSRGASALSGCGAPSPARTERSLGSARRRVGASAEVT